MMEDHVKPYDREELYRKVWEKPLLKVAEEYGVSAVALGKTCRKLSVPLPGRGYWAKLAHGHVGMKKPPLPKLDKVPIIYHSPVNRPPRGSDQNDSEFSSIAQLLSSGALNPSPGDASARLPALIRHTANLLRSRSRKDEHGILLPREAGGLDVRVSEGMLERALQVMSQILIVLERQGFGIEVSETHTVAVINGERIRFGIEEQIRRVVTQKARVPNPTDRWDYDETVSHEPTGKLSLVIQAGLWNAYEQRARWSDGKVQRLETLIGDFVAGLMRTAVAIRRQEDERKQREDERERRVREAEQLRKDIQEEEKKVEQLNQWVESWERAQRLRSFIAVYAEKSISWSAAKQAQYKAWIEWATKQADRLDPFVLEKPASVLDQKHELRSW
jgi:hypothetical protein